MGSLRKLSHEQEREVALAYLCGVKTEDIGEQYCVSGATINANIIRKRSHEWNDPLVEFYRSSQNRGRNSAHIFLAFSGESNLPSIGLIDFDRERSVSDLVDDKVYVPLVDGIIERTALRRYIAKKTPDKTPYDTLIKTIVGKSIFPPDQASGMIWPLLINILKDEYHNPEFSLEDVSDRVEDVVVEKVKNGGIVMTPYKKEIIHRVLGTLVGRGKKVIGMRYGLDGYDGPKSLEETGNQFNVTRTRLKQIEEKALRQLRHPIRLRQLNFLACLATDEDIKTYLENVHYEQEREKLENELTTQIREELVGRMFSNPLLRSSGYNENQVRRILSMDTNPNKSLEELEVSVRTANLFKNIGIKTIGELIALTPRQIIGYRNSGQKTLREIQDVLADLGLSLAQ